MPLTTNYKKFRTLTLNSKKLSDTHLKKIKQIIKSIVDDKKDEYWKNYIDYNTCQCTCRHWNRYLIRIFEND